MKIENIIGDIKNDIIELRDKLEEQFKLQNPGLNFSISLPGIDELDPVKVIALSIVEDNTQYYFSADVHTRNGNRVFENDPKQIINYEPVPYCYRHPFQDMFVNLLRDIIKKNKNRMKLRNKLLNFYNRHLEMPVPA